MLFLIITVIVFNLIAYFIPKRISPIELLATTLFASYLQILTDVYLGLKYHLYGYFDKGVDWDTLLYIFGIYPAINVIFLNYYPYGKTLYKQAIYILCWSILAMVYETIFIWSGTFYLNGWKQDYSVIVYPILYTILMVFHSVTIRCIKKSKENK
ncbi:CBO0543 family protein [Niallia sp. NCCP-28]|uniref:CBO0543 family protein n=1 Tax=Niallia sp. NCCP-28 TaxID=2934712 RepID=UPI00208042C3|nr:CBO0543 family protein [Niallia sp. NCCP-28]GKU82596.1 hypothetical protein NCCP28_19920 [Niallia sp. NCCP-28]